MKNRAILIAITGLPGTGKSTLAEALADELDAVHLNTDRIRHEKSQLGKYNKSTKSRIYNVMFEKAREALSKGKPVILDATFYTRALREPVDALASDLNIEAVWVEIRADQKTIQSRVAEERKYSEADFKVYMIIKKSYEPLERPHLVVRSDIMSVDEMVGKVQSQVKKQSAP